MMFSVDEMKFWLRPVIKTMALTWLLGQPCWNMQSCNLYSAHERYVLSLYRVIRCWWLKTHWRRWKRLCITIYLTICSMVQYHLKSQSNVVTNLFLATLRVSVTWYHLDFYLLNDLIYEIGLNWSQSSVVILSRSHN